MQDILLFQGFGSYVAEFGYLGIFIFFVTVDQITPIPEEVTLLTIGYLAAHGAFDPFIAGIVSLIAFLAVDAAYFYLAKSGNRLVKKLKDSMKSKFMERYKHRFRHHMPKTLLVLNFIPRARMFGPILGGMLEVPFWRFMFYDAAGLVLHTGIYIAIGYIFQNSIKGYEREMGPWQDIIFGAAMVILGVIIVLMVRRMNRRKG